MLVSGINIYIESNHILPSMSIVAKYWVINILQEILPNFFTSFINFPKHNQV